MQVIKLVNLFNKLIDTVHKDMKYTKQYCSYLPLHVSTTLTICRGNKMHILDGSVDLTLVTTNNVLSISCCTLNVLN